MTFDFVLQHAATAKVPKRTPAKAMGKTSEVLKDLFLLIGWHDPDGFPAEEDLPPRQGHCAVLSCWS